MSVDSQVHAQPSGAEGRTSAIEDTLAPRPRTTLKTTSKSSNPLTTSSPQPSKSKNKPPVNPTNQNTMMEGFNITAATSLLGLPIYGGHDSFGRIYYTSGEMFYLFFFAAFFSLFAILLTQCFEFLGGMVAVACVQLMELHTGKQFLKRQTQSNGVFAMSNALFTVLLCVQLVLTLALVAEQCIITFWRLSEDSLKVTVFVGLVPTWIVTQFIYWPLHGYMLHVSVTAHRPQNRQSMVHSIEGAYRGDVSYDIGRFLLIFIGSGGHTTEMLSLMVLMEPFDRSMFRRYVITVGDERSKAMVKQYEQQRQLNFEERKRLYGSYEIVWVSRARYVGQSWFTTPFTAAGCLVDCYRILQRGRPLGTPGDPTEYPQTILCNGPGSAAVFVWVSHVMRMYGLIPANRCATLFIESIARVTSLSLTGKIFYHMDLADAFVVQHGSILPNYPDVAVEHMLVKRVYTSHDHVLDWPAEANYIPKDKEE